MALARALADAGEIGAAKEHLDEQADRFPAAENLHQERTKLLVALGEEPAALALASAWRPRGWAAKVALKLHHHLHHHEPSGALEAEVAATDPADPFLFDLRAERLRGDPRQLLDLSEELLRHAPGSAQGMFHRIVALAQLGRGDEARVLIGLDQWFHRGTLTRLVSGDGGNFLRELAWEVQANPALHADPAGHATRSGRRTRTFPLPVDRCGQALIAALKEEVTRYAKALAGDHPFVGARPDRAVLAAWALLFGGKGHQVSHIHPGCWLTGVFYVSAPPGRPRPGAIRVGALPRWAGVETPWRELEVEPEPGTLLLFPSFVPHETIPTGAAGERISIAFDVAPA